jgi:hypothetical protein
MLAADVLKRVPDALTVASAVITADASSVLPANELKGAWEKLHIPNKLFSFYYSSAGKGVFPSSSHFR